MEQDQAPQRRVGALEVAALAGIGLITGGTAMMHIPTALIVCGTLILAGAIQAARRA